MSHHHPTATGQHRGRLVAVLVLTATVFVVELVGGILSGSLALLADAGHMLGDVSGLLVALVAAQLATRPPTSQRTFGLLRAEVLAALVNALLLMAVAGGVLVEAVRRWNDPSDVSAGLMLAVAVLGAAANAVGLVLLHRGQRESLNLRGAYLEVLGDLVGSVMVIAAGLTIALTGYQRADALASVAIAVLILPRAWSLLRDVVDVLLENTPKGVDLAAVRRHITGIPEVLDVHDLHAWTITSGMPVLSAHVVLHEGSIDAGTYGRVLDELDRCLGTHFDVEHCTFQLEPAGHRDHEPTRHA